MKRRKSRAAIFALTGRNWSTLNDGRCLCGLCVLETIERVADAVQGTPGRRKMLFFIGSDLLLQAAGSAGGAKQDVGCESRLRDAREEMFRAVDRANLTIHSLDPSGLVNIGPVTRPSSTLRAVDVADAAAGAIEGPPPAAGCSEGAAGPDGRTCGDEHERPRSRGPRDSSARATRTI